LKAQPINTTDPGISLTQLKEADLARLTSLLDDPVVYNNTLSIPASYSIQDAKKYLEQANKFELLNGYQKDWSIRKDGELIGGIGLLYNHGFDSHKSEFGYWLGDGFRGQGIMTHCINAFIEFVFSNRSIIRIEAHVFSHNLASCRVLEKCGFVKEGFIRKAFLKDGKYLDAHLYAILKT
jgi:RimJ/RimL family protein N-acetyltransferase